MRFVVVGTGLLRVDSGGAAEARFDAVGTRLLCADGRGAAGDTRSRPLATVAICACSSRYADLTSAKGIVETTFHFVTVSIYALARGGLGTGHTLPACRRYLIFVDGLEETMFYGRDRHVPWRACLFFYAHLC